MKKGCKNIAVAAVARKLTVAIWHLLRGHFTPLLELNEHLETKLTKLATTLWENKTNRAGLHQQEIIRGTSLYTNTGNHMKRTLSNYVCGLIAALKPLLGEQSQKQN